MPTPSHAGRWTALLLLVLLAWLHSQLWLGRGSLPKVQQMRMDLTQLQADNRQAKWRNEQLANEVEDLRSGLEIIEEKARMELGMVKPNEIFVQIARETASRPFPATPVTQAPANHPRGQGTTTSPMRRTNPTTSP